MDIHPPKHPIHSVREFLAEIFTVTCGIVIALGLESAIQAHHDRHLAHQVRDDFVAEITENQKSVQDRMAASEADTAFIVALIGYGTNRLAHQPAQVPALDHPRGFASLSSNAWDTALATQGIGQLSHADVHVLSAVYNTEKTLHDIEAQALTQWVGVAGFGDPATVPDEDVRIALRDLRIAYALQIATVNLQKRLLVAYADALRQLDKDKD